MTIQIANCSKEQDLNLILDQGSEVDASLKSSSIELSYSSPEPKRNTANLMKMFAARAAPMYTVANFWFFCRDSIDSRKSTQDPPIF